MDASKTTLLQGTLDLLILRALSLGANHGLGIARRVQQITNGTFDVRPGSLFPALHRMEEQGWLRSEWGESATKRRARVLRADQNRPEASRNRNCQLGSSRSGDGVRNRGNILGNESLNS